MDQRFKGTVDMDNQVAAKKAAISLQFAPMESFAAMESVHSTSNAYYIHPASVSHVEGIPVVKPFLTSVDAGLKSRQQEFYIQQPNASAEGLFVLNSRPVKQDGLFISGHSSRDDDGGSNLSEDAPSARVKLLCSYGGKILPRPSDGRLRYVGGETRMVTVNRDTIFSSVMVKMVEIQPQTVSIKYQLPDEDLDALVSVSSEEDLENMMEEYDKLEAGDHPRLRVFLFTAADYDTPAVTDALGDAKNAEQQYLDAINGLSEVPARKLSDLSTQSAASSMSGQPGVTSQGAAFREQVQQLQQGASFQEQVQQLQQGASFQEQVQQLQHGAAFQEQVQQLHQITQQAPLLVTQQLMPDTLQVPQVAAAVRSEQDGTSPVGWSSEAQGPAVYTAVGVPFQSDASRLYPNTAFHQTLSAVNVRADGTLVGGQHILVANQNGTGYSLFTNAGTSTLMPDLVQAEPVTSYEYRPLGEKLQKPQELQEAVYFTSDAQLNGSVATTVNQQGGWDQAFTRPVSDFDGSTVRAQEDLAADTRAHISELSAWSTETPAGDGSNFTAQLSPGVEVEPAPNFQLPDSLVNFLEDSLHVASTSVDSCTTEMPQSGNSSNNMPFDLLTSDDFGRASCNSTGSTLPSSAASSSSYVLDNAAALSESPSKFLDNLNTGLLFPADDGGIAEKPAPHAALSASTAAAKDHFSSFAFPANDVERKEPSDHKVGQRSSQDERPHERLAEPPLDTTGQKPTEPAVTPHDTVRFKSTLPDVPDIFPDADDESTANPAETEAIARSCGLQVIRHSDLEEIRELGSGTFGTVYHGKWRGTDVAIKRIKSSCFFGSPSEQGRLKDDFWSEACILAKLHHPNVVAFYGVVPDSPGSTLATVTEFMINGSLKQVLQRKDSSKALDRRRRLLIAMDAAFGMEYLHDKRIIHFDLKGENLLVNMRDPHRPVCKVGDLGLSKIKHKTMVSGGVRGTLPWMAPELLNGKSILVSEKVDVFSFGIVMWELLTGEEPYADLHYGAIIGGIVSNGLRPPIPNYCEPEWKLLMERCWADDPAARPTFTEIANELRAMMTALVKQQHQQAQAQSQGQQSQGQAQQSQGQSQQAQGLSQQAQGQQQQQAQQ